MKNEAGGRDKGKTQLATNLANLSMFATTVPELESPLPSQHILMPCTFSLSYSSPGSPDKDVVVLFESQGSIDFVLCPTDIRVLLGVVQATQRPMVGGVVPLNGRDPCTLCACVVYVSVCACKYAVSM